MTGESRQASPSEQGADAPRILVVDPEEAAAGAIHRILGGAGYEVIQVPTVETALRLLESELPIDAVVLDGTRQAAADLEMCRRYRRLHAVPHPAVVLVLESGDPRRTACATWTEAMLEAPIDSAVLLTTLERTVSVGGGSPDRAARRSRSSAVEAERTRHLEAVRVLTANILRARELPTLLDTIARGTRNLMGARRVVVWAYDARRSWFCPVQTSGDDAAPTPAPVPVAGGDVTVHAPALHAALGGLARGVDLVEPVIYGSQVRYALTLAGLPAPETRPLHIDRECLLVVANTAAVALEHAALHAREQQRSEELRALLDGIRVVMSGDRLQDVLERLAGVASRVAGCPNVGVLLLDEAAGMLRLHAQRGRIPSDLGGAVPVAGSLPGAAVTTGAIVSAAVDPGDGERPLAETDRAAGLRRVVCLPIRTPHRRLGALAVCATIDEPGLPDGLEGLQILTDCVAIAVEQSRRSEELTAAYETQEQLQPIRVRTEKLRALGQLAAGMAHELNNLLNTVTGQAEVLMERIQDPEGEAAARVLFQAASDARDVVRRVQTFARRDTAQTLGRCYLPELVVESLELTKQQWQVGPTREGRPITVIRKLGGVPPVLGVGCEIREALTNLIFNAVDAMPQGGTLTFSAESVTDDVGRRWVELRVADTGVGIPPEVRDRIFDPFFTTKGLQGNGFGLSEVYGIMKRHGGSIQLDPTTAPGATFVLQFQEDSSVQPSAPVLDAQPVGAFRILIVDDERASRRALRTLLQTVGHTVIEAETVEAALARVAAQPIDLVCTDIKLPGRDGFALVRALRESHPAVRIIVVTGFAESAETAVAEPGIGAVVRKPLDVPSFIRCVTQVMRTPPSARDTAGSPPK